MALGVPVVSTAIMGTRDVLRPGCGALVAEEDEVSCAASVLRVLRDRALAQQLAEAGREYVKAWSAPAMARRMETLYGRVIAEYGPRIESEPEPEAVRRRP